MFEFRTSATMHTANSRSPTGAARQGVLVWIPGSWLGSHPQIKKICGPVGPAKVSSAPRRRHIHTAIRGRQSKGDGQSQRTDDSPAAGTRGRAKWRAIEYLLGNDRSRGDQVGSSLVHGRDVLGVVIGAFQG